MEIGARFLQGFSRPSPSFRWLVRPAWVTSNETRRRADQWSTQMTTSNDLLTLAEPPTTTRISSRPIASHYDVVVVGARAAGAATAMLLARRGLRVLAVDRSAYGSDTLSTHSLSRTGVLQLSRWGLLDRIRRAGTPVATTVTFHYGNEPVVVDISADDDVDGLYSPRRTVLDSILVDEAVRCGAEVCHGVAVTGLTNATNGRVDGVELDIEGVRCRIGATWVVGADGIRSRVARQVNAVTTHQEAVGSAVMYGYWTGLPSDVIGNYYDVRGRAAGIIPSNDGEACVWLAVRPEQFRMTARGDLRSAYHEAIGTSPGLAESLSDATCVGGYRGFAGVPGFLRQPYGPGWVLVGDAGYFKDPVSAHGITDAFTSAELLADALAEAMSRDEDAALEAYRQQRDELAAELMPSVAALASLRLDPEGARAAFKDMGRALRHEWALMQSRPDKSLAAA